MVGPEMEYYGVEETAGEEDADFNDDRGSDGDSDDASSEKDVKLLIIRKVKKRPFLYNSSLKSHHDLVKTKNAWEEIEKIIKEKHPDFKGRPTLHISCRQQDALSFPLSVPTAVVTR